MFIAALNSKFVERESVAGWKPWVHGRAAVEGRKEYGEERGCALWDYDGDGREDLVVTQNGAETKLYHNLGAKPGWRVRLKGTAGNPAGVGAVLRAKFRDRYGPAREVHAG